MLIGFLYFWLLVCLANMYQTKEEADQRKLKGEVNTANGINYHEMVIGTTISILVLYGLSIYFEFYTTFVEIILFGSLYAVVAALYAYIKPTKLPFLDKRPRAIALAVLALVVSPVLAFSLKDAEQGLGITQLVVEKEKAFAERSKRIGVVDDTIFDLQKKHQHLKSLLIDGAKIAIRDPKCPEITWGDVSQDKGSKANPVFYYTCRTVDDEVFNVWLSKAEIEKKRGQKGDVKVTNDPIGRMNAIRICESFAKAQVNHPQTFDAKIITGAAVKEFPNGNTSVSLAFTASNAFGVTEDYMAECLVMPDGKVEGHIMED